MIDLDQLERIVRGGDRYGHNTPGVTLDLIAEVRRLREDAERYRWLRTQPNDTSAPRIDIVHWEEMDESANSGTGLRLEELDAAVDAARAKEKA